MATIRSRNESEAGFKPANIEQMREYIRNFRDKHSQLESLDMENCRNIPADVADALWNDFPKLKALYLKNCSFGEPATVPNIPPFCAEDVNYELYVKNNSPQSGQYLSPLAFKSRDGKLTNLETLDLEYSDFTEAQLLNIFDRTPNIKSLSLKNGSNVGDTVLTQLPSKCPQIEKLNLHNCVGLSGDGVKKTTGFANLRDLNLAMCSLLKDDSLADIGQLKKLTSLNVHNCRNITTDCIQKIRKEMPSLSITRPDGINLPPSPTRTQNVMVQLKQSFI